MAEHYLLSSYHLPQDGPANAGPIKANPFTSPVEYVQSEGSHKRLCVAAPALGITVYDLADQTPLSSLTLGPSFRPSSNPASRSTPSATTDSIRVKNERRTWVGVEAADNQTGEVWGWVEDERKDGSVEGEAAKVVYTTPSPLAAISAPRSLPEHLVTLSSAGVVSLVAEAEFSTVASSPAPSTAPASQRLHLLPASSISTILPPTLVSLVAASPTAHLAIIIRTLTPAGGASASEATSLVDIGKKKFKKAKRPSAVDVLQEAESERKLASTSEIEIVLLDSSVTKDGESSANLVPLGSVQVEGSQVTLSSDGCVSSITASGEIASYRLTLSGNVTAATYADVYTDLAFEETRLLISPLRHLPLSRDTLIPSSAALLALHSTFVLLASVRPPTSSSNDESPARVVALVWDVRLGALVSEMEVSVPAAAFPTTSPSRKLVLDLQPVSKDAAAMTIWPSSGPTGRSLVFVVPLSLPSASVLAAVVGKQAATKKYLDIPTSAPDAKSITTSRSIRHPATSKSKIALTEASEEARAKLIRNLQATLVTFDSASVEEADRLFSAFIDEERSRASAYATKKAEAAAVKEKERRAAALLEKSQLKTTTQKYRLMKGRIEAAIAAAGRETAWTEVTAKRIKNVTDIYRYHYYEERKALEESLGHLLPEAGRRSVEVPEPTLPSAFITAVLRLCFPDTSSDPVDTLSVASTSQTFRHPTAIIAYLLDRKALSEGSLPGGIVRLLARAGDWPNLQRALETMPDVAESTSVSLLQQVVTVNSAEVSKQSNSLSSPPPPLRSFLSSFVESPSTPALLREALQRQLTALDVLAVLRVLDEWLAWWATRGGGGGSLQTDSSGRKVEGRPKPKRLPVNPFILDEVAGDEAQPPRVEYHKIISLVQALLDAHFVTLLLQRQSHPLLRRLSAHVRTHVALQDSLSSLLGALSIYARAKDEQRAAAGEKDTADHKSLGASMAARVSAQEKHAAVLEYALEKFYL